MDKHDILKKLMPLCSDYPIGPDDVYDLFTGKVLKVGTINRKGLLILMFEWLEWDDLLGLLGLDGIKQILTPEFILMLDSEYNRNRYKNIRKILHGDAGFLAWWDFDKKL
jgi:hypothetical protein